MFKSNLVVQHKAHLVELFSSVQGEGVYVGERQIFVRFYGCHLKCHYCDTPESVTAQHTHGHQPKTFRFEQTPGQRDIEDIPNPTHDTPLADLVSHLDQPKGLHHSVAITGGEPLVHKNFLETFLPILKSNGYQTYLETSGDLAKPFNTIKNHIDMVAMDMKLPSVTKDREQWIEHREFLKVCIESNTTTFVKSVMNADTNVGDIIQAVKIIKTIDSTTPFIIQPMSSFGLAQNPPSPSQLLEWQKIAKEYISDVRVIPQCHKMMGQL
ncbi:MAG: radical SAM protein [Kiritimatiellae bacterium]|nr:radical SAM protein [Kiritimatiellia bacterium]